MESEWCARPTSRAATRCPYFPTGRDAFRTAINVATSALARFLSL
jgi:hypothetical protein